MTVVATLDITDLTAAEYRAVLDELGVEDRPDSGIYLHLATPTDSGFRIMELWDDQAGFDRFLERRLGPAAQATGMAHPTNVTVTPLHNLFGPRLDQLPGLVPSLPGARAGASVTPPAR